MKLLDYAFRPILPCNIVVRKQAILLPCRGRSWPRDTVALSCFRVIRAQADFDGTAEVGKPSCESIERNAFHNHLCQFVRFGRAG